MQKVTKRDMKNIGDKRGKINTYYGILTYNIQTNRIQFIILDSVDITQNISKFSG